jgi:hypothetical protein
MLKILSLCSLILIAACSHTNSPRLAKPAEFKTSSETIEVGFMIDLDATPAELYRSVMAQADWACRRAPWVKRASSTYYFEFRGLCRAQLVENLAIEGDLPKLAAYKEASLRRRRGGLN